MAKVARQMVEKAGVDVDKLLDMLVRNAAAELTTYDSERECFGGQFNRKGSFRSDSNAGCRFAERLLTVVASCGQQGRLLLAFLVAAVEAGLPPSVLPAGQGV